MERVYFAVYINVRDIALDERAFFVHKVADSYEETAEPHEKYFVIPILDGNPRIEMLNTVPVFVDDPTDKQSSTALLDVIYPKDGTIAAKIFGKKK